MRKKTTVSGHAIGAAIAFLLMLLCNVLAEWLPLFGKNTGEIAAQYPNLFTPPPLTFAIWGVIYLLLALHVLYQLGFFRTGESGVGEVVLSQLGRYFILSCLLNIAWLLAWHAEYVGLSLLILVALLVCLARTLELLRTKTLGPREHLFLYLPFAVYFAWICVAVAANVTVLLVKIGWDGFGWSETSWMLLLLALLSVLALATMFYYRSPAIGLVYLWALGGILWKHRSPEGFDGAYPAIIVALMVALILLFCATLFLWLRGKRVGKR